MSATVALLASALAVALAGWALNAHRLARLRAHLRTDRLTGLANREGLALHLKDVRRGAPAVGLLLLDLNQFKQINDLHGHDEGNRVLVRVGARLRAVSLPVELAVRHHGDEFALLLGALPAGPGGHRTAASRIDAVRRALARPLATGRATHAITASVGGAVLQAEAAELSALLAHADASMYRDKARRNSLPTTAA